MILKNISKKTKYKDYLRCAKLNIIFTSALIYTMITILIIYIWIFQLENFSIQFLFLNNNNNNDMKIYQTNFNFDIQYDDLINVKVPEGPIIGVLMIACNRTLLLSKSLEELIQIRKDTQKRFVNRYGEKAKILSSSPNITITVRNYTKLSQMLRLPIVVSLDCDDRFTYRMVKSKKTDEYGDGVQQILRYPLASQRVGNLKKVEIPLEGYFRIARHYQWAIEQTFTQHPSLSQLIIVEEDLSFGPDFFEYFLSLSPLLANDLTLICISAWNDNGKSGLILYDNENTNGAGIRLLYRTDFFPGLGWMLRRSTWFGELRDTWPKAYWDDWLRHSDQMKGRQCIRPEVPRTSTRGRIGVSKGQYFDHHLKYIQHGDHYEQFFDRQRQLFTELNSTQYRDSFHLKVYQTSVEIHPIKLKHIQSKKDNSENGSYRMTYYTKAEFEWIANIFGLMSDFKHGIPRTAYIGVVSFLYRGHRVYLAPPISRKIYIKQWK